MLIAYSTYLGETYLIYNTHTLSKYIIYSIYIIYMIYARKFIVCDTFRLTNGQILDIHHTTNNKLSVPEVIMMFN